MNPLNIIRDLCGRFMYVKRRRWGDFFARSLVIKETNLLKHVKAA